MKRTLAGLVILTVLLTGCARGHQVESTDPPKVQKDTAWNAKSDNLTETKVTLSDGRLLTCIVYEEEQAGGVSCDWQHTKGTQ